MFVKYLKKLLFTGLFYIMYILIAYTIAFFASTVNFETHNERIKLIAALIIACPIACFNVYYIRIGDKGYKQKYMPEHYNYPFRFWDDFKTTIIDKNSLLDLLAFATLAIGHTTPIAISLDVTPIGYVTGMLMMLALEGTLFHVGNTCIWCFVHKHWKKRR